MPTTIVFDLTSRLVEVFTAAAGVGVRVYDGQTSSADPASCLMVGVGDPDDVEMAEAASGTQEWAGLGARAGYEEGTIRCCAVGWTGDVSNAATKAVRETVRDIVAGVDAACKADPNLGGVVPGLNWVRYGANFNYSQAAFDDGTAAIFFFEIAYKAKL